jgi:hypothetical protein
MVALRSQTDGEIAISQSGLRLPLHFPKQEIERPSKAELEADRNGKQQKQFDGRRVSTHEHCSGWRIQLLPKRKTIPPVI